MWLVATLLGRGIFNTIPKAALLNYNYPQLLALKLEKLEK